MAGLVLNPLIPHSSPLMNRIEFIGNSLFIPFFLISVGMLIDIKVIFNGPMAIIIALVLTAGAIFGKWLAALFTQLISFKVLDDLEDLLVSSPDIKDDDLLILVSARKYSVSYLNFLDNIPNKIEKHFSNNNKIVVYPLQKPVTLTSFHRNILTIP